MLPSSLKTRIIRPNAVLIEPSEQGEDFLPTDNRLFPCDLCGKPNLANARFCGGCGAVFVKVVIPEFSDESAMRKERTYITDPPANEEKTPPKSQIWATVKVRTKHLKIALGIVLGLFLALGIQGFTWKKAPPAPKFISPEGQVPWPDLQSFLSRKLGISLLEADELAMAALAGLPSPQAAMTCQEAGKIQDFFDSLGGQKMSLFSDLPTSGLLRQRNLSTSSLGKKNRGFSDVALDHPVYGAWKNLLKLDLPLGDLENRAHPSEALLWEDWNCLLAALDDKLQLEGMIKRLTQPEKSGQMTAPEIQKRLGWLRLFFKPGQETPSTQANAQSSWNRLDTFAHLSRLIEPEADQMAAP